MTIQGTITYDRVPFRLGSQVALDYDNIQAQPARGVVVYALNSSGSTLDTTTTSDSGSYQLNVAINTDIRIRVAARLELSLIPI